MMTWALVPEIPKEEMPARRGRPGSGQGRFSVSSRTPAPSHSTCREGRSTPRLAGRVSLRIASTILMTPATPAAAWVWPDWT
ncbi:hypothetical protein D9753_31960 [Streptomyces dangxiongensis]|uniref:Uncharacterized protein n=1 Tax=Streptomyces dangxiongensis TaxID=1442032 RepID=A0A3G2JK54_9ACTN|nr:hypothetical protein D9753_31960 [Streptomyces dangxiongensis]